MTDIVTSPVASPEPGGGDDDDGTFATFARKNFHAGVPTSFHRKELSQPVLVTTPSSEKEASRTIFKILMRFMGDQSDYRQNMKQSQQPNMGSVMGRLYRDLGVSVTEGHMRRVPHLEPEQQQAAAEEIKQLPTRPKRGTLRKLKATLTLRLFKNSRKTVFHLLPLEETLQSPLEMIHFIVGYGVLKPSLRDEIYCQICKQLTDNPFKASVAKGWFVLQMVASCFTPSPQISRYIEDYLQRAPPIYGPDVRKVLQRTEKNGTRFQPPAKIEIDSVMQKQPIELTVTLMDGTEQTVVVDAATTSRELVRKLCNMMGMKDKFGFSVFVAMYNKVASLGNGNDHVLDAVSQCEQMYCDQEGRAAGQAAPWRLFFRKELFSPWENTTADPVATNLIFAQVVRGVMLGEYVCPKDEDLALLAAQQYYIEYGTGISDESLSAVLPSYVPPEKRAEDDSLKHWRKSVLKLHKELFGSKKESHLPGPYKVRVDIVKYTMATWPVQFSRYYDVKRLDGPDWSEESLTLAVNSTGVYVQGEENRMLYEMPYPNISSIAGEGGDQSSQMITFILMNGVYIKLEAVDGEDIRYLVTYLMDGLRERSSYAVAVQGHEGQAEGELSVKEGDLLVLSRPAREQALKAAVCEGTNVRTDQIGTISAAHIYVLPTVTKPSQDTLNMFQTSGLRQAQEEAALGYGMPDEPLSPFSLGGATGETSPSYSPGGLVQEERYSYDGAMANGFQDGEAGTSVPNTDDNDDDNSVTHDYENVPSAGAAAAAAAALEEEATIAL